jgi:hypothetical protein
LAIAELVLEYLKVFISFPVATVVSVLAVLIMFKESVATLLTNISKAKLPGGIELQMTKNLSSDQSHKEGSVPKGSIEKIEGIPEGLDEGQKSEVESLLKRHIANTTLWEYRCLNFYFVRYTQLVLDWFISNQPTTVTDFDSVWMQIIPDLNERSAIIDCLKNHQLIQLDELTRVITVELKGKDYQQWRGPLPKITS